jgi:hypothetical protein
MAQTYTLSATAVTLAANKSLLAVFNASGSGRIVRVYRIWILNNQFISIAGVIGFLEIRRITAASGGQTFTPNKHVSSSESFPAQVTTGTGMTVTTSDLFGRVLWVSDEAVASATTTDKDAMQLISPLNVVWDTGYNDSNIEPIVCREGQGVSLQNITSTVGQADVFMEVTLASS